MTYQDGKVVCATNHTEASPGGIYQWMLLLFTVAAKPNPSTAKGPAYRNVAGSDTLKSLGRAIRILPQRFLVRCKLLPGYLLDSFPAGRNAGKTAAEAVWLQGQVPGKQPSASRLILLGNRDFRTYVT